MPFLYNIPKISLSLCSLKWVCLQEINYFLSHALFALVKYVFFYDIQFRILFGRKNVHTNNRAKVSDKVFNESWLKNYTGVRILNEAYHKINIEACLRWTTDLVEKMHSTKSVQQWFSVYNSFRNRSECR